MQIRPIKILLAALAVLSLTAIAACGAEEEELDVIEGEPLELGEMHYNVQITRFLNPNDVEDAAYLEGQPEAPLGQQYLGTFIRVENEGDEAALVPTEIVVRDTRDNVYEPIDVSGNQFALPLGFELAAGAGLPTPDSTAASGAIKGGMILFLVDEIVSENRPLELEIPGPEGETGKVKLDI